MMNGMIPGFVFKAQARKAIKPAMQVLLIIALIAALPGLINTTVTLLTGADVNIYLTPAVNVLRDLMADASVTAQEMQAQLLQIEADMYAALTAFWQEKGMIFVGLMVMEMLLNPVLSLGMYHALLKNLRGQEVSPLDALSRLGCTLKALGLLALVVIKTLLWMLPGAAITLAGAFLPLGGMVAAMTVGSVTMTVLAIRAVYRYALSMYFLADHPEMKLRDCIRRSCEVMKHRKMELFSLEVSFILWEMLVSWLQTLAAGMFGMVVGLTLGMFAMLFVNVYRSSAKLAFYEGYAVHGGKIKMDFPMPGMMSGQDLSDENDGDSLL